MILPLLVGSAILSLLLTGVVRRYALARRLLDFPNARSSHQAPTPRGGGVAIVLTFLLGLPVLIWAGAMTYRETFALWGGGGLVAVIGFLDDHNHVGARWRLLVHFTAAFWSIAWMSGLPNLPVLGAMIGWSWGAGIFAVLYLVWLLNLYNFMDGIDAIASIEAITVCLGGALLYWQAVPGAMAWGGPLSLAAAVTGFLYWNFPPARIFMGDAGSGFLGLVLGLLSIQAAWVKPELFWAWQILLGVFIVDATLTLLRRVLRGENIWEAHRNHAYQNAARRFDAHRPVALAVGVINVGWLLPLALLVSLGRINGVIGVLVAYAPLIWLAVRFKAGASGERETSAK